MLHRSFKPAKCKTSLKLAASRLKLLKNKKEVQLKQLKRELAQLLESGQDQTARIRVEHVVKEEKTVAAYDLMEIYCEIIAARLPIIESQKNCPIDLKEAITSVIFASPRCADITEFVDIRKHFTAKYGKEFVTAAVELRPESGVSRMLIEKLSVKAPDGETKIKILSAIAKEHNIKWDPTSFAVQELKPADDLLNGPNTFENASMAQTGPSNILVPPTSDPKDTITPASFKQNAKSSPNLQNLPSVDVSSGPMRTETAAYPGTRPSGSGSERMDATHSHYRDGNAYSAGSHNLNMEFKDATAAAEAAAERASMAARAAAELSGRAQITTACPTESHRLTSHSSRDDRPSESVGSKLSGKQFSKVSRQDNVRDKDPNIQSDQVNRNEHVKEERLSERLHRDSRNSNKRTSLASLRPTNASNDDGKLMNEHQGADLYLHKRQQEKKVTEVNKNCAFSEVNINKEYNKSDVDFPSDDKQEDLHHEGFNHFEEGRMKDKASDVTSQSHSSNRDHVYGISHSSPRTPSIDDHENLFPNIDRDTTHGVVSSCYSDAAVVFDDHLSDNDDCALGTRSGYDAIEDPSPNSNHNTIHKDSVVKTSSSSNVAVTSDESDADDDAFGFSSRTGYDESLTETKNGSKEKDVLPVHFDDFGGPSSESEDEMVKSGFGKLNHNQSPTHRLTSKRKQKLHMPPGDKQVDVIADKDQRVDLGVQSSMKFDSDYVPSGQLPSRHSKTSLASNSIATDNSNAPELRETMTDDRYFSQSSTESKNELKFGPLRGGLRNKRSPYAINPPVDATTASKRLPEDMATTTEQATPSSSIGTGSSTKIGVMTDVEQSPSSKKSTGLTDVYSNDTDDLPKKTPISSGLSGFGFSRRTKATSRSTAKSSLNGRSNTEFRDKFSSPTSVTGSDSNDSEEELSDEHFNRKKQPSSVKSSQQSNAKSQPGASDAFEHTSTFSGPTGTVPSRRTKASPSSGTKSSTKARVSGEAISSDADSKEKPPSSFYGSEALSKPESQKVKPARRGSYIDQSSKQETSKPIPSDIPKHDLNLKSSAMEQRSSPLNTVASGNSGSLNPSTSSGNGSSKEGPLKKASHVHPKLPDYDSLAAQLQSLRENRQ